MLKAHQPRPGTKLVAITQNLPEYKRLAGKRAAFREWQYKLSRGDKLPRGKYFNGKKAGRPIVIIDEAWSFLSSK